ncbi:MAG: 50S ribosomal protein L28 [Lachnospiraceae bacterium]|nr:50S ribosomal protein L28 [Lachnospiraceae bacterium]
MAKCVVCEKGVKFGNAVSHSHRKSNRTFKANLKHVTIKTEEGNKKCYVCTRCLRSGKVERA